MITYEQVKNALIERNNSEAITLIMRGGSSILVDSPRDEDYMVIVSDANQDWEVYHLRDIETDLFIFNEAYYIKIINEMSPRTIWDIFPFILPLYKEKEIVWGEFKAEYDFDFFANEAKVKEMLKELLERTGLLKSTNSYIMNGFLPRISYWLLVFVTFYMQHNAAVTEELTLLINDIKGVKGEHLDMISFIDSELNTIHGGNN